MKRIFIFTAILAAFLSGGIIARAQMPVPPPAPEYQILSSAELDQLLQPIALYPDPLIAQMLPAATLPSEIVMADRYILGGGDPSQIDQQPWDPSVQAIARYPSVLKWMDDNLTWTTTLGQAFLAQQQDVMASIQRLRSLAMSLGNLQTTPEQNVVVDNGQIEILPPNPEVIYVPYYQPNIVYYQRWSYGTPFISFGIGLPFGAWFNRDFDWWDHHLIEWGHNHPRPGNWWTRRPSERIDEMRHARVWQPPRREIGVREGDRGWGKYPVHAVSGIPPQKKGLPPQHRPPVAAPQHPARPQHPSAPRPAEPQHPAMPQHPSAPRPAEPQHPVPPKHSGSAFSSRPAEGALIGVQSAHETRAFSNRGRESRQNMPKAAAPAHSAPRAPSAAPQRSPKGPEKHK